MTEQEISELKVTIREAVREEFRHLRRTTSASSDTWMTQAQASEYLKISPKTLCRLRAEGKIKGKLFGQRWRYDKATLDKTMVNPWLS
ncbi:MAG: helix-turn-helix domain-containing protein [Candidatus Riflebacteria bacterium]|nr:helix-turn-helix domain-containing protein [Candidatus Riflebacteria bacterium]